MKDWIACLLLEGSPISSSHTGRLGALLTQQRTARPSSIPAVATYRLLSSTPPSQVKNATASKSVRRRALPVRQWKSKSAVLKAARTWALDPRRALFSALFDPVHLDMALDRLDGVFETLSATVSNSSRRRALRILLLRCGDIESNPGQLIFILNE